MSRCLIVFFRCSPAVDGFALWNENCNQSQRSIVLFWGNLPSCEIYHPCHNFRSEMCSDSLKDCGRFHRIFPSQTLLHWWLRTWAKPWTAISTGLIVSRYKVTTGVGGRNGKKHSGNSVWLPEVSYSTVNETSLKVYGCVWEYPQSQWFIIILPMTMAVWGFISPSSETAKQDFHLWYPKNKKTHRDLTNPPKHQ